ncbi:tetratricopeptide repeat protein [Hahella chejuensis]|uniref:Protein containing tetratricopeptide repeat n=1 Tax=Hahella chejuensis (strain KCTC 2396) TaxID=349521 RepID=Q2SEW9_HAHCH|nr:hypothetical protein [Hahella chejuensis]ABC30805.1 protein containing tetratricopeptide repeat [Hahella chejuensis KCTC 2396]
MMDLSLFEGDELLALARLDVDAKRIDEALAKLKRAYQLPEFPPEVESLLAKIYAQLDLLERASFHYESFLARETKAVLERFQYGMVQFEQGIKDRALQVWAEVLEDEPTHPPSLFYASLANVELGNENEARRLIDILLKSAPVDNLYFNRAKTLLQDLDGRRSQAESMSDLKEADHLYN